jgi:hypothetical protein
MWQVALMEMSQRFHLDHLPKVVERALQGCRDIHHILDRAVRRHVEVSGAAVRWGNKTQVDLWLVDLNVMLCIKSGASYSKNNFIFKLIDALLKQAKFIL